MEEIAGKSLKKAWIIDGAESSHVLSSFRNSLYDASAIYGRSSFSIILMRSYACRSMVFMLMI